MRPCFGQAQLSMELGRQLYQRFKDVFTSDVGQADDGMQGRMPVEASEL